jgi:hypothetical protein
VVHIIFLKLADHESSFARSVLFSGCAESHTSAVNDFVGYLHVFPKVSNSPKVFADEILQ